MGDLGGLYGSLSGIGFVIVGFFCSRMFTSDILRKIYQVRKDPVIKGSPKNGGASGFITKFKKRFTLRDYHKDEIVPEL